MGLFRVIDEECYQNEQKLPLIHFYFLIDNSECTESLRKVIAKKLNTENQELYEYLVNEKSELLFSADDIQDIFIVSQNFLGKRLLQISLKLTKTVAYYDIYEPFFVKGIAMRIDEDGKLRPKSKKRVPLSTISELQDRYYNRDERSNVIYSSFVN